RFDGDKDRPVTLGFVNAAPGAVMQGQDLLPGTVNYFPTRDRSTWVTDVPTYGSVRYTSLYPGIDTIFYGNPKQLEYDLHVRPGSDPAQILMSLAGVDEAALDKNGDLDLRSAGGDIRMLKPVAYQVSKDGKRRENVEAAYRLERTQGSARNVVSFTLGSYDHSRELVIDPTFALSFAEYVNSAYVSNVAVDNSGNSYIVGYSNSSSGLYVEKLNSTGAVVWTSNIGTGSLYPFRVALDGSQNVYVVGWATAGSTLPVSSNAYQGTNSTGSSYDSFLLEVSSSGASIPWATYFGGTEATSGSAAYGLAVETISSVTYVFAGGWTYSPTFPTTSGVYQTSKPGSTGNYTDWVAKFNPSQATPSNTLVYSTYLGNINSQIFALGADTAGNVYAATGATQTGFPTTAGAFQYAGYGVGNGGTYVTKLNPTGTALVYSAYLGDGTPNGIAVEQTASNASAYVVGTVHSADWPTTAGAYQTTYAGGYAVKLHSDGTSEDYSTFLGGPSSFVGTNVTPWGVALPNGCASSCSAYISGWTSTNDFPTINPIQNFNPAAGGFMAFVVELSTDGSAAVFSSYLSGFTQGVWDGYASNQVYGFSPAIAVDNANNIALVGDLGGSQDFPITTSISGNANVSSFLARIGTSASPFLWATATVAQPSGVTGALNSINFGSEIVGVSTSVAGKTGLVKLRNLSSTAASISSIVASPASIFAESDDCGGSVPAGGVCTLSLDFDPAAPGSRTGTVTVNSNASDTPNIINLSGNGVDGAYITLSPNPIPVFPTEPVGTTSPVTTVTLTNLGDQSAAITAYMNSTSTATGLSFTVLDNCPAQLAPGNSCTLNLTFDPAQVGYWTDTLVIPGIGTYVVSGTGLPPGGGGTLAFTQATMDFGTQ